jgi:hypothetical protein
LTRIITCGTKSLIESRTSGVDRVALTPSPVTPTPRSSQNHYPKAARQLFRPLNPPRRLAKLVALSWLVARGYRALGHEAQVRQGLGIEAVQDLQAVSLALTQAFGVSPHRGKAYN